MNTRLVSIVGLAVLLALFFGVNMLFGAWGRSAKIDLTQGGLYTLSDGSRSIARSFTEPVNLTLYYSSKLAQGRPAIQSYAARVREMLEEYAQASRGMIRLKVVDPQPFSEDEDAAVAAGLTGAPVSQSDTLYFGLVGTNSVNTREVIPFFDPSTERFLEYDVSRVLYSLAHPTRRVVGLISSLPITQTFDPMTNQPLRVWQIVRELRSFFTVNDLGADAREIPKDVDVLMVVHPKNLPQETLFAIDQYVLKGGKLFVAVDPLCESDQSGADPRNPMAAMMASRGSSFSKLFEAWGIELVPSKIAADLNYATPVLMGGGRQEQPVTYVAWLSMSKTEVGGKAVSPFSKEDAITGTLTRMNLATPGYFLAVGVPDATPGAAKAGASEPGADADKKGDDAVKPEAALDPTPAQATAPAAPIPVGKPVLVMTPLIQTTADAAALEAGLFQFMPDPKKLLADYSPGGAPLTIAARFSLAPGAVLRTAFPEGRPPEPPAPGQPAPPPAEDAKEGLVTESTGPVNIIAVADCDFLNDRFWIQEQRIQGISLGAAKIADNGDFVINAIDNLSGSNELISIRARGEFARPFDRVQAIAKSAEQQYRAEERALDDKIQQAQARISELQRQKPGDDQSLLLSDEQQKEIDNLREEMLASRKQLRAVQLNLRRDVDDLGTRLKIINIALMPLLVAGAAVTLGAWRLTRKKSVSFKRDA